MPTFALGGNALPLIKPLKMRLVSVGPTSASVLGRAKGPQLYVGRR